MCQFCETKIQLGIYYFYWTIKQVYFYRTTSTSMSYRTNKTSCITSADKETTFICVTQNKKNLEPGSTEDTFCSLCITCTGQRKKSWCITSNATSLYANVFFSIKVRRVFKLITIPHMYIFMTKSPIGPFIVMCLANYQAQT